VQNGFVWGNQIIPILDNQFLPVFRTATIPSDILTPKAHRRVKKMRIGNNSGFESDFERVVGDHPLIIFLHQELVRERPSKNILPGRSRRVLRGNGVQKGTPRFFE